MVEPYFTGERLTPPRLRFSVSSLQASHSNAYQGLKVYGPYDSQHLAKEAVRAALIYPNQLSSLKALLQQGLVSGDGAFGGFQRLFRVPLEFCAERRVESEDEAAVRRAVQAVLKEERLDIVMLLTSQRHEELYATAKAELLGNGIPSQVITAEKLQDPNQRQWILGNIALQIYAKIGGTPWTVMAASLRRELVLGVSRAVDRHKNVVVGFVTLFTADGDYQFLHSLAPKPMEWAQLDAYRDSLANLIAESYEEYSRQQGAPASLVIHLCKRPGKFREIAAVEQALQRLGNKLGNKVPYALIHLNDDSNYRLFDTADPTYVPETGIKVSLSRNRALLFLDGRPADRTTALRRRKGVPRVLEVVMDRRSTLPFDEFPRLVGQVFEFARVNWRGFNAGAVPATLNYSALVARLVAQIGTDRWNAIASAGALRDKAWFL